MLSFSVNYIFCQKADSLNYNVDKYNRSITVDSLIQPLEFFERDKEISLANNNFSRAIYDLYYISNIEYKFRDLHSSEKSAVEALELLDKSPKSDFTDDNRISFYNHLGRIRRELRDYSNSNAYYQKSLSLSKKRWDSALAFNNMSRNFIELNRLTLAKSILLKSYKTFEELKDTSYMALSLSNLGVVQSKLNEQIGETNLIKALSFRKKINDSQLYESYKFITDHFMEKNDTIRANYYAKEGYVEAKKANNLSYRYESLSDLIDLGELSYSQEFKTVSDEVLTRSNQKSNTYALAKYNIKDEKTKRLRSEYESERNLFIAIAIFLTSFSLLLVIRTRYKRNIIIKQFETEQRISKKLHDEVANDVFHIMTKAQSDHFDQLGLVDDLEEIYHKTRDLSIANSELDVSEDYVLLLNDLLHGYKTVNVNIFTKDITQAPWDAISDERKKVLYRVLQELMTNMKKHSDASLVTLIFEQTKNKIKIDYTDNGVGCEIYKGNGLRNTENRIEMVGGSITFESEPGNGFKAKIRI